MLIPNNEERGRKIRLSTEGIHPCHKNDIKGEMKRLAVYFARRCETMPLKLTELRVPRILIGNIRFL